MSGAAGAVEPRDCPYLGLDYYQEKFGAWFFGREAERDKIITNLAAARLTLLHAESGVGKSSLLRAGVAWQLRRQGRPAPAAPADIPVVFSSWQDDPVPKLIGAIAAAVAPFTRAPDRPGPPEGRLDAAIEAAATAADAGLLVILDQFEEYFLYRSREPVPERFADELARCVNRADLPANFLIAIREDAYAGLGDLFKGRIANVYGNYLHIDYLDRASAEKAIRGPVAVYNGQPGIPERIHIQDELVEAVLDQVRAHEADRDPGRGRAAAADGDGRVATPLLQLVMETIWLRERAEGSAELRLSTLQGLQGVGKIVDTHLWKALRALGGPERQTAIDMFDHLVTPSGGKIAEPIPDLARRTGHREEQVEAVLDKLDHARIVRPVPAPPGQDPLRFRRYEIFHDVLTPAINRTIAVREERRRARRFRRWTALAVGLLVLTLAVGVLLLSLYRSAVTQKEVAESGQLAATADANAARDPAASVRQALRALRLRYTGAADSALRNALPDLQAVRTLQDGRTVVLSAEFDPADPGRVATADKNGAAWIWDVATGRHLVRLLPAGGLGAAGTADVVAFNPAGTKIAVGYGGGMVDVFSARSGRQLEPIKAGAVVNDVQFVGSTGELAIATQHGVGLWRPGHGPGCCDMVSRTRQANSFTVDPADPLKFAMATRRGTVIWSLRKDLRPRRHRTLDTLYDNDAEFSPDGRQVVTAAGDGDVQVYDLATGKATMTLAAGDADALSAAFSPDETRIVAAYSGGAARVWDASTGLQLTQLAGNGGSVQSARFSADGREVVTAGADGTVRVWHAQPRELQAAFPSSFGGPQNRPNPVYAAEYSPDGGRIITVDGSGNVSVFTSSGEPVYALGQPVVIRPGAIVQSARFNRAGTQIVTADENGTVDLWHASGADYARIRLPAPIRLTGPANYAAFSPDGSRVAIVTSHNTAEVRSARTGRLLQTLNPGHAFLLSLAVFSPDGRQILTGDGNGQVEVWDSATGQELRVLGTPGPSVSDVEFSRTGREFVTASVGGAVTVWDARDDRPLHRPIYACPTPSTASFSPDGSKIVVACGNGSVPVFAAASGQQLTVLPTAGAGTVNSAAFSPDGRSVMTAIGGGGSGDVRIWNAGLATPSLSALERDAASSIANPGRRRRSSPGLRA